MVKISASLMCANWLNLEKDLEILNEFKVDLLHVDIMDGHFVPNLAMNLAVIKDIRKISNIPLDIHLMVNNPEQYIDRLLDIEPEYVSIHIESTIYPIRFANIMKQKDIKCGLAFNPYTIINKNVLQYFDFALIMTVEPGFAGQNFIPFCVDKVKEIKNSINEIQVDGGLNLENAKKCIKAGANIIVGGTTTLFKDNDLRNNIIKLKNNLENL